MGRSRTQGSASASSARWPTSPDSRTSAMQSPSRARLGTRSTKAPARSLVGARSEPERHPQRWTAKGQVLDELVAALVVVELAVGQDEAAPVEVVVQADEPLIGARRRACADIAVIRHRPVTLAERDAPTHSSDRRPDVLALAHAARARE